MRNIHVFNNTFYNNGGGTWGNRGGIVIDNPNVDNIVIRNNICSDNEQFQIAVNFEVNNIQIDHNLIDGYRGGNGEIRGTNFIENDPAFANPLQGDFHLRADSPAIDSGSPVDAPSDDIDGNSRPRGRGYDRGAYEAEAQNE